MSYNFRPLVLPLATVLTFVFILVGLYFKAITPANNTTPVQPLADLVSNINAESPHQAEVAPLVSTAGMFTPPVPSSAATAPTQADPQSTGFIKKFVTLNLDQASISPQLFRQLQKIFSGVLVLNKRSHDRFTLLFEETFLNGKVQNMGNILLATVTHQHRTYQIVRYTDHHGHMGYYNLQGRGLIQSEFLPAPVQFKRISDRFTMHRWHPILHIWRPHLGIDYAAKAGTPILAIASGRISLQGWGGGYGNVIVIRHDNKFQSLYAHLSKFNSVVKQGAWVKQGQVIGYVGMTGLATGPHLHFGLYEYGVAINPELFLPKRVAKGIPASEMNDFLVKTNQLLTHLAGPSNNTMDG